MSINASSYFRPCDCEGGVIEADTTVYLAPSAAADSPTGVIGSDTIGEGTDIRPFYSIKRAMEYLEDYRIKVGRYITIRGLPGYYHYNDDHATVFNHKDNKYIKIQFDAFEPGQHLETQVDFNTAVVIDDTNYDSAAGTGYVLVTFVVNDIGTGFYQIKPGDYIKMSVKDYDNGNSAERAVWNGFHRVTAVDVNAKKVTVMYKYYGHHNTSYPCQLLPATLASTDEVKVWKLSTHVYVTVDDTNILYKGNYLYSEYGMNSIQINASCENHYNPIGKLTWDDEISLVYIYDGIINDVRVNINGFNYGTYFINLLAYWDESDIEKTFSTYTSCNYGLYLSQSKTTISKITGNNNRYSLGYSESSVILGSPNTLCSFINCYVGIILNDSSLRFNHNYDYNKKILCCYCDDNGITGNNFFVSLCSVYISHCYYGVGGGSVTCMTFASTNNDLTGKPPLTIDNCHIGIYLYYSSLHIRNCEIANGGTGIDLTNSTIKSGVYTNNIHHNTSNGFTFKNCSGTLEKIYTYNNYCGLYIIYSTINMENIISHDNDDFGFVFKTSTCSAETCNIYDNYSGIYLGYGSYLYGSDINITNNDTYGIFITRRSKSYLANGSTSNISGNSTNNIRCYGGSQININSDNAISNMNPSPNVEPSWSGYQGGNFIGYTNY